MSISELIHKIRYALNIFQILHDHMYTVINTTSLISSVGTRQTVNKNL